MRAIPLTDVILNENRYLKNGTFTVFADPQDVWLEADPENQVAHLYLKNV